MTASQRRITKSSHASFSKSIQQCDKRWDGKDDDADAEADVSFEGSSCRFPEAISHRSNEYPIYQEAIVGGLEKINNGPSTSPSAAGSLSDQCRYEL